MINLELNKDYINSWNIFSRVFLIWENFVNEKKIVFFDSIDDLKRFEKIYDYFYPNSKSVVVDNYWWFFSYYFENSWVYLTTKDIFTTTIPDNYELSKKSVNLQVWSEIILEEFIKKLIDLWYSHSAHLSKNWSYNVEGDIINLKLPYWRFSYKISLFGQEIDEILIFDNLDKNKIEKTKILNVYSASKDELISKNMISDNLDKISNFFKSWVKFFIWLDFFNEKDLIKNRLEKSVVFCDAYSNNLETDLEILNLEIDSVDELKNALESKKVKIFTKNIKTVMNFIEYNSINNPGVEIIEIIDKKINLESYQISSLGSMVICDDILSNIFIKKRYRKSLSKDLDLLLQIKPWDYIVHIDHGVWIFKQIVIKDLSGIKREYVEIEYRDNDKLFVPIWEIYRISKYIWNENPKLTWLNSTEWSKIIKNTEVEVEKIANELLEVYAKRSLAKWYPYIEFKEKEEFFRTSFWFKHTFDQEKSIEDVLYDMKINKPMDRLLTGDVWFWKTEVACNAIYRAFLNKKQVAFISPLVILAYEHFDSLKKRFKDFWVRIDILTRVSTQKEQTQVLKKLANGEIDCIIWTHRLLSEDISFKNLWLLIVDEEHKFWVIDKEKINKIKLNLDILSLSATPIPRSLNFALNSIKDISIISTAPFWKKPIKTIVSKFSDEIIRDSVSAEIERRWQVIFIHNRVATIESTKKYLEQILPKWTKIVIVHGQMSWIEVEDRIIDFKNRKYDILLATTVIENWVNFLDANTIIINDAETFWLSQLHQLRWRVWRWKIEWHCYLLYRRENLPDDAKKRLVTIVNNTHLWAWFEIAMRDLEIRWAWDILGIKQSWKSKETWISLYIKLLEEKIEELKTWEIKKRTDCKVELNISYYIPDDFFESEVDKISFFRNIESIETVEDLEFSYNMFASWKDIIPEEFTNLFLVLKARIKLSEYWVIWVKKVLNNYFFEFDKNTPVEKIREFLNIDKWWNFVLVTIHKIKVDTQNYKWDRDFLGSLID